MDEAARGVADQVRPVASDALGGEGIELVDLEFRRESGGWVLRLFIDKPGGVGIEDCQRVSEIVGTLLEVEDPIPHAYTLEVSSPGLTRPLRRPEDWQRAEGSLVKIVTREPIGRHQAFVGRVLGARPDVVRIAVEDEEFDLPLDLVARARLEVDWPAGARGAGGGNRRKKRGRKRRQTH
jgi:ribosome maturation factor RimP